MGRSSGPAFLLEFLFARLEHLIVRRFFEAVGHQLLAQCLFFI